jgi:hypothetical protein
MWRHSLNVQPEPMLIKDKKVHCFILLLGVIRLPKLKLRSEQKG